MPHFINFYLRKEGFRSTIQVQKGITVIFENSENDCLVQNFIFPNQIETSVNFFLVISISK